MKRSLSSFFSALPEYDLTSLEERVVRRLIVERRTIYAFQKKKAVFWLSFAAVLTLGVSLVAGASLVQSEFWKFLSLIFSDFSTLVTIPSDFVVTLLETAPIVPLTILSAAGFFLFWALDYWTQIVKKSEGYQKTFQYN